MRNYLRDSLGLVCPMLMLASVAMASGAQRQQTTVSSRLEDGWIVEYHPRPASFSMVEIDGKPHMLFDGSASLDPSRDHTGEPLLPVEALTFGVPADAYLDVELLDPEYEVLGKQLVAPYPVYVLNEQQEPVSQYIKKALAYSENRFFPSRQFVVDKPVMFRDQRIATIRLSPYRYNPVTGVLQRMSAAQLRVYLRTSAGARIALPPPSQPISDPLFEGTYESLMINYEDARGWRLGGMIHSAPATPADSTRDWFETGKPYFKIPIASDGWYRVTKAQLVAAGANPSLIDLPTLKIFFRGAQIPIVVRADTSVDFYGRHNYGDSTYTDFYTDTSAYWLTWGGATGLRFTPSYVDSAGGASPASYSLVTRHFEQNNYYFQGTTATDIINMETIPGEGWAWGTFDQWFFPNTTNTYSFSLDSIAGVPQTALRVRLVSTTPNFATPNHRARFWVNDSLVGEATFPGRTTYLFSANIPLAWVKNGGNTLKIQSIPTSATTNQFYLDWFEVDYNRTIAAQNNQAELSYIPPGGLTRLRFTASGFTTPLINVYDLSSQRQITSTVITNSGGVYSVAFRDSLSSQRSYMIAGEGGAVPVPSVTQKMFTDIRTNAQGADYIIITHRNFLAAAGQLAAQRQTVNGVRTTIITVDDIYDEFNYGVLNATTLKAFLKYAYQNWPAPRPAYVLFFGDACWDYHGFLATTVNTNFVPSYGVPASDNWYVSFSPDTVSMPFMLAGRIPVKTIDQAQSVVQKLIGYDAYALSEWNKTFLFITGGNDPSEQSQFNSFSEDIINTRVLPPPIGGTALRVYKTTRGVIDGENKAKLQGMVQAGLVFMNFIGHSGGRIWGVDIGPPSELQNTDGKLPFVASVSCNVGGFADPSDNVLAEEFLLANNRGSIATWASSTLGYPTYGRDLVRDFLQGVRDSVRTLGALTTNARIKMLRTYGQDFIAGATVNTNNLLGDPLSRFALPLKPDLSIRPENIVPDNSTPTVNDTLVNVRVKMFNYGLVTPDSVGVTVRDTYNGQTTNLVTNLMRSPMYQVDSLVVPWRAMNNVGLHTLTVNLDPQNRIPEVSELNNIASRDQYVYANLLSIVKPIRNMVVAPGVQRLVATSPIGVDSAGFTYEFQLDTVDTFNSPGMVASGAIPPTAVTGEWSTPSLANDRVYFWRARTTYAQTVGKWVESSFSTSSIVPALPRVRWRENSPKQFRRDILSKAAATDTGVTIQATPPINLYVRSVGYRYNQLAEYYSTIKVNEQAMTGYWWELGSSFMVARISDFSGAVDFRSFNLATFPADSGQREAQRMTEYLNQTPVGNYIAWSVIFDGSSNVSESLFVAMERYGSTRCRTVQPGQSWAFIGRKGTGGPGMTALESLTNDTAVVSLMIPNYYGYGNGSLATPGIFVPTSWNSFFWQQAGSPATNARVAFLGVRPGGGVDTLRVYPKDSSNIDLQWMNAVTSGEKYGAMQVAALLSTTDALVTPALRDWWMDLDAPADLAISARTVAGTSPQSVRNIEVTVYNVGYQDSDSSTVSLSMYDREGRARPLASISVLPISIGSSRTATIPLSTTNMPRHVTLQAAVTPAKKAKDLVTENNTAYYSFDVPSVLSSANMNVYADGTRVMDGDYVPATPVLVVDPFVTEQESPARLQVDLYVDNRFTGSWTSTVGSQGNQKPTFMPQLSDGSHQLRFTVSVVNSYGDVDTAAGLLHVNVSRESRILQMYNYPNPFSRETYFTFTLSGSVPPEELTLRIFTVSGRKIRELVVPSGLLRIGANRVFWDGRDMDGDEVANGYYFYQISMRGNGKEQSAIQKLVKVR